MKKFKNTFKKIFILNLIFCLIFSNNAWAITEEIAWAPGRDPKAKNAKPATNNGNDKNGLQTYFYIPRTGQWESTNDSTGAMMLHMAFNEVGKQKGAYGTWSMSGNHIQCGTWFGTGTNVDGEQPFGFIKYFGFNSGDSPEEPENANVEFSYESVYENPEVMCGNYFKCGSTDACSSTTCAATINITIDPSPIGNYAGGNIKYYGLVDNTHTNWVIGGDGWNSDDGIYTCPEQNGSIQIADNKKWSNPKSPLLDGEIFEPITTTIEPFKAWKSGRIYGMDEQDQNMTSGENVKALYNNVSLSIAQFDLGNYIWPYFKMKYVDWTKPTKWEDVYCISAPSRVTNPLIVYTATNIGDNNSSKKFSLDIDSQWDGWSSTMEGLDRTGILDANGGDRNCVVNGGSTVFVKASDTSNKADTLRFCVTGFIPLYNYYDLNKITNSSNETMGRSVWAYCGCDDDAGDLATGNGQCQQYPFNGLRAYYMADRIKEELEKNLGHVRLQLMAAEGIYRQGEEHLFEQVAQCVKGANENDTEQIVGGSKSKGACGTFGSFTGTAGKGKGNKLDSKNEKYNLKNRYDDVEEHNDSINIKCISSDRHFYQAWIDTRDDNKAKLKLWDYDNPNKIQGEEGWDDSRLYISTSYAKTIDIRSQLKDKQSGLGQDIDELFANVINNLPNERWKQMERMSGWLTNHLAALDFGCGGDNLRPSGKSYLDSAGHGQTKGWFNEGLTDIGILEFQYEYELDFNGSTKWLVMDPALCGQAVDQWDLKNWTDNNNDGKKDDNLTKPGALKDKVRTLRFQLSDMFKYNDDEEIDPYTGLAYWGCESNPLYQKTIEDIMRNGTEDQKAEIKSLLNAGRGETDYLATLCVIDRDGSSSVHYGSEDWLDTFSDYPHWLSVPVYLNFNTALKSKFFYIDNSTVQDNYN